MPQCSFKNCKSRTKLHKFPTEAALRDKWTAFCGYEAGWSPGRGARLCSLHFEQRCYASLRRIHLKPTAVPTLADTAEVPFKKMGSRPRQDSSDRISENDFRSSKPKMESPSDFLSVEIKEEPADSLEIKREPADSDSDDNFQEETSWMGAELVPSGGSSSRLEPTQPTGDCSLGLFSLGEDGRISSNGTKKEAVGKSRLGAILSARANEKPRLNKPCPIKLQAKKSTRTSDDGREAEGRGAKSSAGHEDESYPHWFNILVLIKTKFNEMVTSHLAPDVSSAVREQRLVEDTYERSRLRSAIERRVLSVVNAQCPPGSAMPPLKFFGEVVTILGNKYPSLYREDPLTGLVPGYFTRNFEYRGRDKSGADVGIRLLLPRLLQKRLYRIRNKISGPDSGDVDDGDGCDDVDDPEAQPDEPRTHVYGVVQERWYASASSSAKQELQQQLEAVDNSYESRSLIYSRNRDCLQALLTGNKNPDEILANIRTYFADSRLLREHFEWLSGRSIVPTLAARLGPQLEQQLYNQLGRWTASPKTFATLTEVAEMHAGMLGGIRTPVQMCLIRELNQFWHRTRCGLIRNPTEPEPADRALHIVLDEQEEEADLRFSLQAGGHGSPPLYVNLSLSEALAAYFHAVFVGNLVYPAAGEAVAVWLQRRLAGIDEKGSRAVKIASESIVQSSVLSRP